MNYRPKCYCTATLKAGVCPHGCDPALRRPASRRIGVEARAKTRDHRAGSPIGLATDLVVAAARKHLPDYGKFGTWAELQRHRQRRLGK